MQSKVQGMLRIPPSRCIRGAALQSPVLSPRIFNRPKKRREARKNSGCSLRPHLANFLQLFFFFFFFSFSLSLPPLLGAVSPGARSHRSTPKIPLFPNIFKQITALGLTLRIYSLDLLGAPIHLSLSLPPRSFLWKLPR